MNNRNTGRRGNPPPVTRPLTKVEQWSNEFCANANGLGSLEGLKLLGPINKFEDILLPANHAGDERLQVAAEQVVHLIEGWRYASASTNAFLNNSNAAATHFAYYAELHAAQSLFAWSGIRIKWGAHYYLDSRGNKKTFSHNPPTHEAVWAIWSNWVLRPDIQTLLAQSIRLHPLVSLDNVVKAINFTRPNQYLRNWGADLVHVLGDRDARNDASYEALLTRNSLTRMQIDQASLVQELWMLLLADGQGLGFDAALCAKFVSEAVNAELQKDLEAVNAGLKREKRSEEAIRISIATHISSNTGASLDNIVRRLDPRQFYFRPFDFASSSQAHPENVICRSFFLLRMALLALKSRLSANGMSGHALSWIENWLDHAGIWSVASQVEIADIETDYKEAVEELDIKLPLPSSLWTGSNIDKIQRVARPDACIAWGLVL